MKSIEKKWRSFALAKLIIAVIAVIGFGFSACGDDDGNSGNGGGGNGGGSSGSTLPTELRGNTYINPSGDKLVFGATYNITVTLKNGDAKTFRYWEYNDGYLFFNNSRDEVIKYENKTLGMVKLTFPSGVEMLMGPWTKQ
jgi:hypothetical protein